MKHLLNLLLVVLIVSTTACLPPPVVDESPSFEARQITVGVVSGEVFREVTQLRMQKISLVPGFKHQYDTCKLVVSNQNPDLPVGFKQFTFKNPVDPLFNNIGLSLDKFRITTTKDTIAYGVYNFYVSTLDNPPVIGSKVSAKWFKSANDTLKTTVKEIILPGTTDQSLILIDASLTDGVPTIKVGTVTALMSRYGDFYYAYVIGECTVQMSVGGKQVQKVFPYVKGEIYNHSPYIINLKTTDPFKHVTTI